MNRERWVRIDAILDLALDADPSQREAVLAAECGDDQELAAEVRKFLASVDDGSELFESTPHEMMGEALAAARTSSGSSLQPGDILGHYRLIEKIGSGGMGAVYHAERADGEFEKRVALKVIKRGLDTDEVVERFQTERRILARLQHPHIAALLDGGATPAGLPYFVMEYAPGEPIDRYVRRSGASLEERIRLFLIVCEAVQYAHQNLIVHRDLKPSNILVDQGNPKLLDFGIAKVLDPETGAGELATQITERRLTPQYAAPEQVVGQPVSTATDVYSLGVILYELVTEHAPYEIKSRALVELERVVCNTNPRPPSAVARETRTAAEKGGPGVTWIIPPDLDAIILCALKKEPERRYGSVAAFSHDLQRFLEGRTVTARPDTALYRISKFVRRNAAMVGVGTAAVLAISIGAVVAGWQARVAGLERDRAEQQRRTAVGSRDFLLNMFEDLDYDRLGGQRVFTQAQLIELGLGNLKEISTEPGVLGPVMNTLGHVIFNMGDRARADSLFRAAQTLLEPLAPHPDLAASLMGMGLVHLRELRADEAIDAYRQALAMRLEVLDPADVAIAESEVDLAFALYTLGESRSEPRSDTLLAEAESLYESALTTLTEPTVLRASALEGLADLELARGREPRTAEDSALVQERLASAEEHYREAIRTGAIAANDTTPEGARRMWGLAIALDERGSEGAAVDASRRALAHLERAYGASHPDVALAHYYLGMHLQSAAYFDDAAASFERSAEISAASVQAMESARPDPDNPSDPQGQRLYAGDAFVRAGQARIAAGQPAAALADLERSLPFYEATARSPGVMRMIAAARIAEVQRHRGRALTHLGEPGSAVSPFRAALSTWTEELGRPQTSPTRARTVRQSAAEVSLLLAEVFELLQQPDSARHYRARAAELGGY